MNPNQVNKFFIIVAGNVVDFDGIASPCEYNIPCNPNETVKNFISRFFQISGLKPVNYRLYLNEKILEKYGTNTLAQIGLKKILRIDLAYIKLEVFSESKNIPKDYKINIKFIKSRNNSIFNCNKKLNGILKLCLLNEIALKIDDSILDKAYYSKNIPNKIYFILKILKNKSRLVK